MSLLVKVGIEVPLRYKVTSACIQSLHPPPPTVPLPVGSLPLLSITFALQPAADLSLYFPRIGFTTAPPTSP